MLNFFLNGISLIPHFLFLASISEALRIFTKEYPEIRVVKEEEARARRRITLRNPSKIFFRTVPFRFQSGAARSIEMRLREGKMLDGTSTLLRDFPNYGLKGMLRILKQLKDHYTKHRIDVTGHIPVPPKK